MLRRHFLKLAASGAVAALGQAASAQSARAADAPRQLRIGYQKNGVLLVAKQQQIFEKRFAPLGIEVKFVEFSSGPPLLEALNTGSIDYGTTGDSPPIFAQAAAIDRISNGRFIVNIVSGGNPTELAGDGIFLSHDERYAHAAEFLTVFNGLLAGKKVDLDGRYVKVQGAQLGFPPVQKKFPVWFGGSSDPAIEVAAEHTDVYLTWAEPLDQVAQKIDKVRKRAKALGRQVKFGLRLHFVVRETEDAAWAAADRLISDLSDKAIEDAQAKFAKESDSIGQHRMSALHGSGRRDKLVITPNLWAGVGLVRGGAGTALVGDPKTVAKRLREYQALGIETIIGSGYPHLEEAYRVGELLFPELGIGQNANLIKTISFSEFGTSGTGVRIAAS